MRWSTNVRDVHRDKTCSHLVRRPGRPGELVHPHLGVARDHLVAMRKELVDFEDVGVTLLQQLRGYRQGSDHTFICI